MSIRKDRNGETPQLRWWFWRGKAMFLQIIMRIRKVFGVPAEGHFTRGSCVMPLPAMCGSEGT